jgi:CRP-like cAMP-binding protein
MKHPFRQYIATYTSLPLTDWQLIEACLQPRTLQPGELLLEEGRICRHLFFMESGFLRYFVWRDGKDITKFFTEAPYCFTSQQSFSNEIPAAENIESLDHCQIWQMRREDAYRLLERTSWNTFIRKLIQEVQFYTEELLYQAQNETAVERYQKMIERNDPLLQKAPLKDLASYLGIAPQSLSRIRKKLTKRTRT